MPRSKLFPDEEPDELQFMPFPVAAGASMRITRRLEAGAFKPMRVLVRGDVAGLVIVSLLIGRVPQFVGDPIPAEIFATLGGQPCLELDTVTPAVDVEIEIANRGDAISMAAASLFGLYR